MIDTSKIIHAPVGGGRYTVTAPIVKEDYGLYLKIEGLELPSTYEVDFSNSEHNGTSVTMIGNADGVLIPSQFISSGKDVFAFLYHVGANYGRTVYKFRIPNKLRPDRTNETPTPEEQSTIDQAISALNSAVSATAQDVIDAGASAQSASQSAENAHDSAVDAQNYAESASGYASDAQGYANTASQKATAAGTSADQAAQIKTDIEGYISTAQGYAQTATDKAAQASQSATNASNSATTASTKAGEASASATTASNKASEAIGYATTASNKATEASGYASTASQKASDASDSATAALGYKTDAESAKTAAQTAQGKAEDAQEAAETAAASVSASAAQIATNTADIADLQTDVAQNEADILKAFPTDSASGSIASFTDGADDIPLKSLIVDINPVQDLSQGDPSPENICPISGWTGMNLIKCNANLWDDEWYSLGNVMQKVQTETSDFYGYYWGSIASWASAQRNNGLKTMFPNGVDQLTVSADFGNGASSGTFTFRIYFYYSDGAEDYNGGNISISAGSKERRSRTSTSGKKCTGFVISTSAGTGNQNGRIKNVMVSVNGETEYVEPVANPLIPISWQTEAGTVYGGKLDVLSGVMTVTFVESLALDTLNWAYYASGRYFYAVLTKRFANTESGNGIGMWDRYKYFGNNTGTYLQNNMPDMNFGFTTGSANKYIYVKDSRFDNAADFKASLAGSQFICTMSENNWVEIQLTPTEVRSLLGTNNIFADTGDTIAEYRADTTLYISRLTEPDADMIADSNITSGKYFMVGNSLFKATANIASGGQVIVGTNCTRKSLSEALNEINS